MQRSQVRRLQNLLQHLLRASRLRHQQQQPLLLLLRRLQLRLRNMPRLTGCLWLTITRQYANS